NLQTNMYYKFAFKCSNEVGQSPETRSKTHIYKIKPPNNINIQFATIDKSNIIVYFDEPNLNGCNKIENYFYSLDGGITFETAINKLPLVIPNIKPNKDYKLQIIANTIAGNSIPTTYSKILNYTLLPPYPPIIKQIEAKNGELEVHFNQSPIRNAPITKLFYSIDGGLTFKEGCNNTNNFLSPLSIKNLTNGLNYTIVLKNGSDIGNSAISNKVISTPICSIPNIPLFTATGENQKIKVEWKQPKCNGMPIENYELFITDSNGQLCKHELFANNIFLATINNLENGKTYFLQMQCSNAMGKSHLSEKYYVFPTYDKPTKPIIQKIYLEYNNAKIKYKPSQPNGGIMKTH
ncbi:MAG: hypothetical protein EBX50_23390, partial [Chitinophagia bacterium]|nr:hypothetical protein [Chitinophagia bacterium]